MDKLLDERLEELNNDQSKLNDEEFNRSSMKWYLNTCYHMTTKNNRTLIEI